MPAKGKGGCGKGKKVAKPKAVLPSIIWWWPCWTWWCNTRVPITSTPTTPPESPVEPPSKKSKKMRQLTAEEEDNMAEWLKDNSCIYNKKLDSYCQTDMKKRLWIEKAKDFPNIDVEYLTSWYKSMRTCPGSDQRDKGILRKFSWLKIHISRQRGK